VGRSHCRRALLEQPQADESDPGKEDHGARARGSTVTERRERSVRSEDGGHGEKARDPRVAPRRVPAECECTKERCEEREHRREARLDLVGARVPRSVVTRRVDSSAIEVEDAVEERRDTLGDQHRCTDAADDVGTERAPQAKPEQDHEDPCEVRSDLVVDPRARGRHRTEVRDVVVRHAVRGWLRQTTRDPSDVERHECEEPADPGEARRHV